MRQAVEDDFWISVQPADEGRWSGVLIDAEGVSWPVGLFNDAEAAIQSSLQARARAVNLRPT